MKNLGYKLTLLIFFIALLSGFYMRLPLWDNLIRAFVIYLAFSVIYLVGLLLFNQFSLESLKNKETRKKKSAQDDLKQPSPNMAK
ncbi:MAG: hypothetical protein P8184_02000 [Calditrichia bacterium]